MSVGRRSVRWVYTAIKAVSIVFFGSVLLFTLINIFVAYHYPRDTRAIRDRHPAFNETMKTVYERIYKLPISAIREIIAECWMENAWIFEPYVQFRERPRDGKFVNISTDGFRLNSKHHSKTFDHKRPRSIFIFGGSTTFGYGVRDEDTIGAHLENLLTRHNATADVAVYNFGRGFYGSSQELLLLKSLVLRGIVPKVAVFIDGVNEQFCPTFSSNLAEVFRIVQHDPAAKLREVVTSLPVVRLASSAYSSELATNAIYINRALRRYSFECGCPDDATCHMQLLRMVTVNKQLVRTMAKEFGFDVFFILQPMGGYRNRFSTSPEGTKRPDVAPLWREYERVTANGQDEHSFAGILDGYQDEAFVDLLHYTSEVHHMIAEKIYAVVLPSITNETQRASPQITDRSTTQVESGIEIPAAPTTVFSHFTDAAKVPRWLGRAARINATRNGEFSVELSANTWIRGTFVLLDPPRHLVLSWRWEGKDTPLPKGISQVDVSLTPRNGGVLVRIVHAGIPSSTAQAHRDGWTHYLTRLSLAASGQDPGPDTWTVAAGER